MNFCPEKNLPMEKNGYRKIPIKKFWEEELVFENDFEKIRIGKINCLFKPKKKLFRVPQIFQTFSKKSLKKDGSYLNTDNSLCPLLETPKKKENLSIDINLDTKKKIKLLVEFFRKIKQQKDFLKKKKHIKILISLQPFLLDGNPQIRLECKKIFLLISKKNGISNVISSFKNGLENENEKIQKLTAEIFSFLAVNIQIPTLLPFVRALYYKSKTYKTKLSVIQILKCVLENSSSIGEFEFIEISKIIEKIFEERKRKLRSKGAILVSILCRNNFRKHQETLLRFFFPIFQKIQQEKKNTLTAFIEAGSCLLKYISSGKVCYFNNEIFKICLKNLPSHSIFSERIFLKAMYICVKKSSLSKKTISENFSSFFDTFFPLSNFANKKIGIPIYSKMILWFFEISEPNIVLRDLTSRLLKKNLKEKKIALDIIRIIYSQKEIDDNSFSFFLNFIKIIINLIEKVSRMQFTDDIREITDSAHKAFEKIILKLNDQIRPSLLEIAGFLKWELKNKEFFLRKWALKILCRTSFIFTKYKERVVLGHFGVILFNHLNKTEFLLVNDVVLCLNSVIQNFPPEYCIPPLTRIIIEILPIMKIKSLFLEKGLYKLTSTIIRKDGIFLPKRELNRLGILLIESLKVGGMTTRKLVISSICKIAKKIGPMDLVEFILNQPLKNNSSLRVTMGLILSLIIIHSGHHFVVPNLLSRLYFYEKNETSYILSMFICVLEFTPFFNLVPYLRILHVLMEEMLQVTFKKKDPVFFLFFGQMFDKTKKNGFDFSLREFIKIIWEEIFYQSKYSWKFLIYSIKKLLSNWNINSFSCVIFQGLFHRSENVRKIYWKIYWSLDLQNSVFLENFFFISGSDRFNLTIDLT